MKDLGTINVDEDIATKGYVDSAIPDISSIEANVIAIKTSTDKIGATGDTGGTSSAGSVMAKSNKIITDVGTVSTNVSTANTNIGTSSATASASGTSLFALLKYLTGWATSARGTKIDNIGATGDTGGSASAGTVMGKENKIITDVGTVNTNMGTSSATASSSGTSLFALLKYVVTSVGNLLTYIGTSSATASASGTSVFALLKYVTGWATSARGTKIDNIGATGDTGGTASAGTLMAKGNKIISDLSTNMSTIQNQYTSIANDIGIDTDTGDTTLFGKLNNIEKMPSISHTVWQSSYKKFSSQYNINCTNTGSSSAEKCYYYKIGSLSFAASGATDLHVNMLTTGIDLNDTLSATSPTVELYISTSNYSSGSTLANRTTIANNSIWSASLNLSTVGTAQEFVMIDNRDWVAGTTYYVYVAVHGTLPASSGQIKLKTPLIDFQCFYTTGSTTTNTGLRKRIIARAKSIDSAYYTNGKHVYELESMVISDTNCKFYYPYIYTNTGSVLVPIIAGNYIRFLHTASSVQSVWNNKAVSSAYRFNAYVGPYVIIEEYY